MQNTITQQDPFEIPQELIPEQNTQGIQNNISIIPQNQKPQDLEELFRQNKKVFHNLENNTTTKPTIAFELELEDSIINLDIVKNNVREGDEIGKIYYIILQKQKDNQKSNIASREIDFENILEDGNRKPIEVTLVIEGCSQKIEFIVNPVLTEDKSGIQILKIQAEIIENFLEYLKEFQNKNKDHKFFELYSNIIKLEKQYYTEKEDNKDAIYKQLQEFRTEFDKMMDNNYDFKANQRYQIAEHTFFVPMFDLSLSISNNIYQRFDCVQTNILLPFSSVYRDNLRFQNTVSKLIRIEGFSLDHAARYSKALYQFSRNVVYHLFKNQVLNYNLMEISGIAIILFKQLVNGIIAYHNLSPRNNEKPERIFVSEMSVNKNLESDGLARLTKDDTIALWKFLERIVGKKELNSFIVSSLKQLPDYLREIASDFTKKNSSSKREYIKLKDINNLAENIKLFLKQLKISNDIIDIIKNGLSYNKDILYIYDAGYISFPLKKIENEKNINEFDNVNKLAVVTEFRNCPPIYCLKKNQLYSDLSLIYKLASAIFNPKKPYAKDDININYGLTNLSKDKIDNEIKMNTNFNRKDRGKDDIDINYGLTNSRKKETAFSKFYNGEQFKRGEINLSDEMMLRKTQLLQDNKRKIKRGGQGSCSCCSIF